MKAADVVFLWMMDPNLKFQRSIKILSSAKCMSICPPRIYNLGVNRELSLIVSLILGASRLLRICVGGNNLARLIGVLILAVLLNANKRRFFVKKI